MGAQQSIQAHPPITAGPDELWGRAAHSPVPRPQTSAEEHPAVATASLANRRRDRRVARRSTIDGGHARGGARRRRASEPDVKSDDKAGRQPADLAPAWFVRRRSAVELPPRVAGLPSGALRIPGAALLFEAFLDSTVFQLLPGDAGIAAVAPIVLGDDMAMHALLALSASSLSGVVPGVDFRARYHYGRAVKSLRDRVTRCVEQKTMETDKPSMLLTVLLLCNYELNCGDPHKASFIHLDGARKMLRNCESGAGRKHGWTLLSFILEYFGFMAIAADVLAVCNEREEYSLDGRTLLPALHSLEELRARFGFNFGLSHPVLSECPRAIKVSAEEGKSIYQGPLEEADDLQKVKVEKIDDMTDVESEATPPAEPPIFEASGNLLRLAVLLVLEIISHGPLPPDKALLSRIDPLVDDFFEMMDGVQINSVVTAPLMWSCVMFGSCTRKPEQQAVLKSMIRESSFKPAFIKTVTKVLEHIWSGEDIHAFGPFGIKRVLALRNLSIELKTMLAD